MQKKRTKIKHNKIIATTTITNDVHQNEFRVHTTFSQFSIQNTDI